MTFSRPDLSIVQWNCRSLRLAKLEQFKAALRVTNPSVVLLSETHWNDKYTPIFSAYQTFYTNRHSSGGGVAILVRKGIRASAKPVPPLDDTEAVGATIRLHDGSQLDIFSIYSPDGNLDIFTDIEAIASTASESAIIGGDFNPHHPAWEDGHAANRSGRAVSKFLLNDNKFTLITPKNLGTRPSSQNYPTSTIDLTFTTTNIAHLSSVALGPYWSSDHFPVFISIGIHTQPEPQPVR